MTLQNRTAPFLGKGVSRPWRINPATGGVARSEGSFEQLSVGVAFVPDQLTLTEPEYAVINKLREALGHILSTEIGEYDWLPEFGSRPSAIIHDPNNIYSRMEYETWAELATARWEKRARIKAPDSFKWLADVDAIDRGEAQFRINPEIFPTQQRGNLVAPFVSPREARSQEYPTGQMDSEGHDWTSRYLNAPAYDIEGGRMLRPRRVVPLEPRSDDGFYTTRYGDTWWRISSKVYNGEVRFWWVLADCWAHDCAEQGMSRRQGLKVTEELDSGLMLRYPSKERLLTEIRT